MKHAVVDFLDFFLIILNDRFCINKIMNSCIKNHEFFEGVDWKAMLAKQVPTPFVPPTENENDSGNIDKMFTK